MNLKSNKRGDIPITILVIGIAVVCFFALFTFYMSENISAKNLNSIGKIVLIGSEMEKYNKGIASITSNIETDRKGRFLHFPLSPYSPAIDIRYYFP